MTLPSASAEPMIVSRYGTRTSSVSTLTPNLRARRSSATATWVSPAAAEHGLAGLVVAIDDERRILGEEPLQRARSLSSSACVTGLRATPNTAGGGDRAGPRTGESFGANVVPVCGVRQLGDGADVAGDDRSAVDVLLAAEVEQAVQALLGTARRADEALVDGDRARQHLEQRDLADELVGDRLEHVGQRLAGRVGADVDVDAAVAVAGGDARRAVGGGGAELADEVGEAVDADTGERRAAEHGELELLEQLVGQRALELGRVGTSPDR